MKIKFFVNPQAKITEIRNGPPLGGITPETDLNYFLELNENEIKGSSNNLKDGHAGINKNLYGGVKTSWNCNFFIRPLKRYYNFKLITSIQALKSFEESSPIIKIDIDTMDESGIWKLFLIMSGGDGITHLSDIPFFVKKLEFKESEKNLVSFERGKPPETYFYELKPNSFYNFKFMSGLISATSSVETWMNIIIDLKG